jgi:hypothetical protein
METDSNTDTASYEQCPVCLEVQLKPEETKTFPCHHSICGRCYVTHTSRSIRCPFCRRAIQDVMSAKEDIIVTIFSSLSEIERSLQKLGTCGFPKPLKNETELRMRLDKVLKEATNQGIYDNWANGGTTSAGPNSSYYTRPFWTTTGPASQDDDLNTFIRFIGSFNNDFFRQNNSRS